MKHFFLGFSLLVAVQIHAQHKLEGRVLDHTSQQAIPLARIYLLETVQLTLSDSTGYFQFTGIVPQKITLLIEAKGYESKNLVVSEKLIIPLKVELNLAHINDVDEVTVDAKSMEISNRHMFSVEYQKLTNLNRISTVNLGEVLAKIPGVYQSSTGNGISKPVIRGMQGMRVLTFMNGLRMEGQQWGSDHGMGISDLGIGSVEVVKGPASLFYGADALGGVLYFVDEPYASNGKQSIEFQQSIHTSSLGSATRFLWKKSGSKYRGMFGVSYASHADFQIPNQQFAHNTRFDELVMKGSFSWNNSKSVQHLRLVSNQIKTGIPGETEDSVIEANGFQSNQRGRTFILPTQHFRNHSTSFEKKWFFAHQEFSILLGQTWNQLMEFEDSFTEKAMQMNLWNSTIQAKYTKEWRDKNQWTTGFQGMIQFNQNNVNAEEILMPNAHTLDQGVFSVLKVQVSEKCQFTGGLRMDLRLLTSLDSIHGQAPIKRHFVSPNGSIGLDVQQSKQLSWQVHASTGYRAPHLTELLANGFHHGALRYEIGSVNLISERALQMDFTVNYRSTHFDWSVNPFYTYFSNFIYLNPLDSIIGGMPVFQYQQMDHIQMYGIDLKLHYHLHRIDKLHMESNLSYLLFAEGSSQSVSLVPQPRLANTLSYQMDFGKKWKLASIEFTQASFFQQNQVAAYENPSRFYQLCHSSVHVTHTGIHLVEIELSAKNITNSNYIDHLSRLKNIGMPSQGRSFILSVKWKITT
jgi:iron complex outermembrane receptor protein